MMKYLHLLVLFAIWSGCRNPAEENKKPAKIPLPPRKINQIHFFMETSASMEGYFRGPTEFVESIPNIIVDMEESDLTQGKPLKIHYIAGKTIPFAGTTQEFIRQISTMRMASSKSSEMHRIFEMVSEKTGPNDLSILVSDCILSYPDAQIRENPEINKERAAGELRALIKSMFRKLKGKGIAASLYGFNSAFYGNYYNYQNTKIPLRGASRPYYLWVIGHRDLVDQFNGKLNRFKSFAPFIALDFGAFDKPVTNYEVLFGFGKEGAWRLEKSLIENVEASIKKPSVIAIAVDLGTLPTNLQTTAYLEKSLKPAPQNLVFRVRKVMLKSEVDKKKLKSMEKKILDNNTHVILLEVSDFYQEEGLIRFALPLQYGDQYKAFSIMDDLRQESVAGKTFALEHLIGGVRDAYQNPNENFVHISIPVKK